MMDACPNCSNKLRISDAQPGNVLVCGLCAEILVVGGDGSTHHATPQETAAFPDDMRTEIEDFQKALLAKKTEGMKPS